MNCPCGKPVERKKFCSKYCMRYYNRKKWNEQNRERKNEISRASASKNREAIREKAKNNLKKKAYDRARKKLLRETKPEVIREARKRHYAKNRDKIIARIYAKRQANLTEHNQRARGYGCQARKRRMESEFALLALQLISVNESTQPTPLTGSSQSSLGS